MYDNQILDGTVYRKDTGTFERGWRRNSRVADSLCRRRRGNLFCFSVRESDFGAIYYYDHEFEYGEDPEEHVTCLAESITVFINSMTEDEDDECEEGEDEE